MTKKSEIDRIKEIEEERLIRLGGIISNLVGRGIISEATKKEKEIFLEQQVTACDIALRSTCQKSSRGSLILLKHRLLGHGTNHSPDKEPCGDTCVRKRENMREPKCFYSTHSEKGALDNLIEENNLLNNVPLKIYNYKFIYEDEKIVPVPSNSFSCERCSSKLLEKNVGIAVYRVFRGDSGIYSVNLEKWHNYNLED